MTPVNFQFDDRDVTCLADSGPSKHARELASPPRSHWLYLTSMNFTIEAPSDLLPLDVVLGPAYGALLICTYISLVYVFVWFLFAKIQTDVL